MSTGDVKEREELASWKEIAEFLGVSVRTAQRWETDMALPVRRLGGEKGRAVAAYADELRNWKSKHLPTAHWWSEPRFVQRYAVILTVVTLTLGAYVARDLTAKYAVGQPHSIYWRGATLAAIDNLDREVWRRTFQDDPRPGEGWFQGDVNGDGRIETIVPLFPRDSVTRDTKGAPLLCISYKGKDLWRIRPARVVSDRTRSYSDVYVLRGWKVFPSPEKDGTLWTVATFANAFEYPSVAIVVDGRGKQLSEYWHSGHLDHVATQDLDGDGIEEILLAGMTLGLHQAVVRVFDPRNVGGADVLPPGDPNQLLGFSAGTEKATIIFERTRLNRKISQFNWAYTIHTPNPGSPDRSFRVSVREFADGAPYLIYRVRPDLGLDSVTPSVSLLDFYLLRAAKDQDTRPLSDDDIEWLRRGYRVERPAR